MRTIRWSLVLACLAGMAGGVRAEAPAYMAVFLNDVKAGHMRSLRTVSGGEITNLEELSLTLQRGEASVTVGVKSEYSESAEGRPLRFAMTMQMGPMVSLTKRGRVVDGRIELTTEQMGVAERRTVPYPAGALMPEAARKLQLARGLEPGTKYSFPAFDGQSLSAVGTEVVIGEPTSVALIGQVARCIRADVTETTGGRSVRAATYVDDQWNVRKIEMDLMGMRLKLVACDEKYALGPNGQVDLLDAGSVASPAPIAEPRKVKRATFTLAPVRKEIKLELPNTGSQQVKLDPDGTATVTVTLPAPTTGARPYMGSDPAAQEALKADDYIQSNHPDVKRQALEIVGDSRDATASGRAIEKWVRNYITNKNLSVGYAGAVATLKSRAGDCSEHAVLTAALCRAAGIPCRVVVGVAYVESFGDLSERFIGHAWNEAYIGGAWVPLDASLGADAARVALAVGGGDPTGFIGMANSLGNFKITRVQVK